MTAGNYAASLAFVWGPGRDSPNDGPHTTVGDPGGLTNGGITQATWAGAVRTGIVPPGRLANATDDQLSAILRTAYWSPLCDALPPGLDLLTFNGRVMTGRYTAIVQQCLGFMGTDCDNWIGPVSLAAIVAADASTLIRAVSGSHVAYLAELPTFRQFGNGWTTRITAAMAAALALAKPLAVA